MSVPVMLVALASAQGSISYLGAIFVIGPLAELVHEISDTISALFLHILVSGHVSIRHRQIATLSVYALSLLRFLCVEPLLGHGFGRTTQLFHRLGLHQRLFDRSQAQLLVN